VVARVRREEAEEREGGVERVRRRQGAEEGERGGRERGEALKECGSGGEEREVGAEGGFDDGGAERSGEVGGGHGGVCSPALLWREGGRLIMGTYQYDANQTLRTNYDLHLIRRMLLTNRCPNVKTEK
jgi:hypothetical protein